MPEVIFEDDIVGIPIAHGDLSPVGVEVQSLPVSGIGELPTDGLPCVIDDGRAEAIDGLAAVRFGDLKAIRTALVLYRAVRLAVSDGVHFFDCGKHIAFPPFFFCCQNNGKSGQGVSDFRENIKNSAVSEHLIGGLLWKIVQSRWSPP